MPNLLQLYLPALIPSWRFFEEVGPSPRIEIRVGEGAWRPYQDPPTRLTAAQTLFRLIWNPEWTEHLFLVSCAEKLVARPSNPVLHEMMRRLTRLAGVTGEDTLQFRLKFLTRQDGAVVTHVAFESAPWRPDDL